MYKLLLGISGLNLITGKPFGLIPSGSFFSSKKLYFIFVDIITGAPPRPFHPLHPDLPLVLP